MENTASSTREKLLHGSALLLLLGVALGFRLYGLEWDGGYLFHPDERQVLIVVEHLSFPWPPDWAQLFSPESPWNPGFFAYGSLPLYLLRICASVAGLYKPEYASLLQSSYIIGRVLSALFDVGTVYLLYRLGRKLYDGWVGLLAAALVTLTVLHIQLAHFYTVDTLLTFFVVLTVSAAVDVYRRPSVGRALWLGVTWGMALATKISAAPLAVPIALAWALATLKRPGTASSQTPRSASRLVWGQAVLGFAATCLTGLAAFLVLEPYALLDIVTFLVDIVSESYMAQGVKDIPYTRQFIGTLPYVYPVWQATVWSLGIPLGIAGFGAALAAGVRIVVLCVQRRAWRAAELCLPLAWVLVYFGITGAFKVKFLRYMLPILPFLCLWAAWGLWGLWRARGKAQAVRRALGAVSLVIVLGGTALYAVSYLNIYRQEHPWIQATAWLCEHLTPPSRIMGEHWDDPLPLLQGAGGLRCYRQHEVTQFKAYDPDDTAKFANLLDALQTNDYIILSTNRLYNTIPRLPQRYPMSSRYYELLMGERLGFELVYYAAVYPQVGGISLVDDTFADPKLPQPRLLAEREAQRRSINLGRADESFTVYDHPKPLVFKKTRQLSRDELLALFGPAAQNLPSP